MDCTDTQEGQASLRPVVWKIMLKVDQLDTAKYLEYVSKGPSSVSAKSEPCFNLHSSGKSRGRLLSLLCQLALKDKKTGLRVRS